MQQNSISQRATKDDIDGLKSNMEANLDGLKDQMKANMDDKVMEYHIKHQQQVLQLSKENLNLVQNQMKQWEDQHCNKISFDVGDCIFYCYNHTNKFSSSKLLRIINYCQISLVL